MQRRDKFRDHVFCCLITSALATCRVPVMSVIWPHFTNPASLIAQLVKNPPQCRRPRFYSWVRKIHWRRERLSTPVFWPGEFHGLQSLRCCKESDVTERLSLSLSTQTTAALNRKNNPPLDLIKNPKTSINRRINKECACVCVFSKSRPTLCDPECACVCVFSKSCLTLCDPMDCSPPGSSVSEISQARILEWVSISSSKRSS